MKHSEKLKECQVCHKSFAVENLISGDLVSEAIFNRIHKEHPDFALNSLVCKTDLNRFRADYVKSAIEEDVAEVTQLEDEVLKSIQEYQLITDNLNTQFESSLTFGDRLADLIATFGGSWSFIVIFSSIIGGWIIYNEQRGLAFDPYPYILLNLVLSCLAAMQAPVIMMSQNRQADKDRMRAELDYKINLKAELEIRHLKLKLDQLASHQWRRLLEIQMLQTELIEELSEAPKK